MIKTTVNITIDRIKYSMAYAIVDVTVQTWAGPNESKVMNRESIVVLREELDSRIGDDEDREPLFLFILGEIFQRSMFRVGYGAEVVEIRDMLKIPSMRYLLYYEPGVQSMINVKVMRIPDLWYEQQAFVLMGMILATKAEGRSLFPNKKEDRGTQGVTNKKSMSREEHEAHVKNKLRTNTIYNNAIYNRKADRGTSEVIARKPISQEEWDAKLRLGWPEYELENMYSVFVSDEQYEKYLEKWKNEEEEWDTYDKDK